MVVGCSCLCLPFVCFGTPISRSVAEAARLAQPRGENARFNDGCKTQKIGKRQHSPSLRLTVKTTSWHVTFYAGARTPMTKTTIIAALTLTVLATEAPAQSTTTFYNSNGQSIGRATTSGNTTTFRDAGGQSTARSFTNGNATTTYDNGGRVIGRETTTGNTTTFRDSGGRTISRSTRTGNTTTAYDSGGRVISRETTTGNTTTIYDPAGRNIGRYTTNR